MIVTANGLPPIEVAPDAPVERLVPYRNRTGYTYRPHTKATFDAVRTYYETAQVQTVAARDLQEGDLLAYRKPEPTEPAIAPWTTGPRPLTAEGAWTLGRIAGDGWTDEFSIGVCVGRDEEDEVERVREGLVSFGFDRAPRITDRRATDGVWRLYLSNKGAAQDVRAWIGRGARNKRIPGWLERSVLASSALAGVLSADGHAAQGGRQLFCTVSEALARQVWRLALAEGRRPLMSVIRQGGEIVPGPDGPLRASRMWRVFWTDRETSHRRTCWWRDYYCCPVIDVR